MLDFPISVILMRVADSIEKLLGVVELGKGVLNSVGLGEDGLDSVGLCEGGFGKGGLETGTTGRKGKALFGILTLVVSRLSGNNMPEKSCNPSSCVANKAQGKLKKTNNTSNIV